MGNENNRVHFKTKDTNMKWRGFEFFNIHTYSNRVAINPFKLDGTYFAGTKVEYLTITGATGASWTMAGYFSNIVIDGVLGSFSATDRSDSTRGLMNVNGFYFAHSEFPIPQNMSTGYQDLNIMFDNDILPGSYDFGGESLLIWSNRFATGTPQISAWERKILLFNTMSSINCGGQVFGNAVRQSIDNESSPSCKSSDNVVGSENSAVSSKKFAYWHDSNLTTFYSYQSDSIRKGETSRDFMVTLLDANGVVNPSAVKWTVEYVSNAGNKITVKEEVGSKFNIVPPASANYTIKITSADNSQELIGVLSRSMSAY